MLNILEHHNLAISRCGIPLTAELLHVCFSNPEAPQLEQAMIWLALLHGLNELDTVLAKAESPLQLSVEQAVGLFAALHLAGNPSEASAQLQRLLASSAAEVAQAGSSTPWLVMNRVQELAKKSSWANLIHQASLLHLSDPAALFEDWLSQLERSIDQHMPFAALLRFSIFCRSPEKLPKDWQSRLAATINAFGDLADAIPLYRFWMVACQVAPAWDFAYIRAADLALRFEDFAIAEQLLRSMEPVNIANPWFYDVQARCRYAHGDLKASARMWSLAINYNSIPSSEQKVFHDRLLFALRGKFGLGEVSRLMRCGQTKGALELLRIIILHDPDYAIYYKAFASLNYHQKTSDSASEKSTFVLQRIERLTIRFNYLWQEDEDLTLKKLATDPLHLPVLMHKAEALLDECEKIMN
jgi:hypothetical protein